MSQYISTVLPEPSLLTSMEVDEGSEHKIDLLVSHLIFTIYLVRVNHMIPFIQMHFKLLLIMEANIMNADQTALKGV